MYQEQPPETMKKTPLKDTQNCTSNKSRKYFHAGQEIEEAAKRSAMRSLTPNVVHNRTEASQVKLVKRHGDRHNEAGFSSQDATASLLGYPSCSPPVAAFAKRTPGDLAASECLRLKVNTEPEICRSPDVQKSERLIRLQMLLRQLDESDQSNYVQKLLQLSPLELSRHAVELEKRSMQLSVEEAREIKRMQVLNVFGSSSRTSYCKQHLQQTVQSRSGQ